MRLCLKYVAFAALVILFCPQSSIASSTGSVSSGSIKPGLSTIEWRNGYTTREEGGSEDERYRSRVHVSYGLNEKFGVNLIASVDKRKDQSAQYDATTLEFDANLLKQEQYGVTAGIRFAYALKDGDKKPDNGEIRLMLSRKQSAWSLRFNQLLTHQIGEDSADGFSTETRWQAYRSMNDNVDLGIEGYHDFGSFDDDLSYSEQEHTIGPVVKLDVAENTFIESGYRAGISDAAPDNLFKINFGYNF